MSAQTGSGCADSRFADWLWIPIYPVMHSEMNPATRSDLNPATIPI
jgi:hypothetical protein